MRKKIAVSILMCVGVLSLSTESFAWDGYTVEIANYAEDHYNTGEHGGQCAIFVQNVLLAVTGINFTQNMDWQACPTGWVNQVCYDSGLKNTYQAVPVDPCDAERGDIFTVDNPHIGIVSENVVCNNGKIEKFVYTDSNHFTTSNPYGDELVWENHSDSNRYYLNNSSLHFWRVGKSKTETPILQPVKQIDYYPTFAVFNNRLYQATKQVSDGAILIRYTEDGDNWEPWIPTGGYTPGTIQMAVFTPQGKAPRLYQAVRGGNSQTELGSCTPIYTRYTEDGVTWKDWQNKGGCTPGEIHMVAFTPHGKAPRLYQAVRRGDDGGIVMRYTEDGETWSNWTATGGTTSGTIQMMVFTPQGKASRLYQAVRAGNPQTIPGTSNLIYTHYTEDGETWKEWKMDGYTPGEVHMAVFTPQGKTPRLYQAVRGENTVIYTHYTEDGETWITPWDQDIRYTTTGEVQMINFTPQGKAPRLYQVVRGGNPHTISGTCSPIYTRYTEDGNTWKNWDERGGCTAGEIQMTVFTPTNKPPRLYQGVRGGETIYTRYYLGESDPWTAWTPNNIEPPQGIITATGGYVNSANGFAAVSFSSEATSQSLFITIRELGTMNLPLAETGDQLIGQGYDLLAFTQDGQVITRFSNDVYVTLRYDPSTYSEQEEQQLIMKYYDEQQKRWIPLPSTVNAAEHTVTATTSHFTMFAIFAPVSSAPTVVPTDIPVDPTPSVNPPAVPEPTTFILFGVGLLTLIGVLSRRSRK